MTDHGFLRCYSEQKACIKFSGINADDFIEETVRVAYRLYNCSHTLNVPSTALPTNLGSGGSEYGLDS